MGMAKLSDGKVTFQDCLFFKYPTEDGEVYDMIEYSSKYCEYTQQTTFPVMVHQREYLGNLVWVYEHKMAGGQGGPSEYIAKWHWAEGVGLVKVENWDHYGEIFVMQGFETESDVAIFGGRRAPLDGPPRKWFIRE
jgi:hypothetical protein